MLYREERKTPPLIRKRSRKNLEPVVAAALMLEDKKRQELLLCIKKSLFFSEQEYSRYVKPLIDTMAIFYQNLPETSLYYSHRGGLLDRALNRTEAALMLMNQLLIRKDSETPSEKQKLWLYAVFSAGMLRGCGKLYGEYKVSLFNDNEDFTQMWRPLHEHMSEKASFYSFEFTREINERGRNQVTVSMATKRLMPEAGLSFLSADLMVFYTWLALLAEERDGAGALDAILDRGDALALQRYLLSYIEEHKYLLAQANTRIGTFQDATPETILERERVLGAEFLIWVRDKLADGRLVLNQREGEAFITVAGIILKTDMLKKTDILDQFLQEHIKTKNKFALQRAIRSWRELGAKKDEPPLSEQFKFDNALLPESVKIFNAHKEQIATVRTLDLLYDISAYSEELDRSPIQLQQLNEHGQWVGETEDLELKQHPLSGKSGA